MKKIQFMKYILLTLAGFCLFSYQNPNPNGQITDGVAQLGRDTTKWIAPDSANALVNPIEADEESLLEGKAAYRKHCRSCHGRLGDGKGTGAVDLTTEVTNFTNPEFLEQSDGSMFWKIGEGRNDMEAYKKKMTEEEIWLTVIYIKTFASPANE
ncbi:MAG: c-type cytochrome [Saprospiraceae bacterium]|nr:c-type cytochrome [Saprospiraceae bacterium]